MTNHNGIFEIAYAAASGRLCLFTGTGFSKAVTAGAAPTWQGLLEAVAEPLPKKDELLGALFPPGQAHPLAMEEAAQVLQLELRKIGRDIYADIAERVVGLALAGDNAAIAAFLAQHELSAITTNYDKLLEELAGIDGCHSLTPGLPVPRSKARVAVYHVHGSIDSPDNMVVTSEDYFRFINGQSYFSRKLSTILHENTVVILGYSLGDTNLKAILSDYKGFSRSQVLGSNLFLVSRLPVSPHIKDYYAHCFGIRVIDNSEVHAFFEEVNAQVPTAEKVSASVSSIRHVIGQGGSYAAEYLILEHSFYEIVASIGATGMSINDPKVVATLGTVLDEKTKLTGVDSAWVQYEHLAKWLIYLASILELKGTAIEQSFLKACKRSMDTMASGWQIGYSWAAYRAWANMWPSILVTNRLLIKAFVIEHGASADSLTVISHD